MRRMADANGRFKMTAVDQRPPIKNLIKARRHTDEAPWEDVAEFKKVLIEELQNESSAMLLDPHFAYPHAISCYLPAKGLILTLEDSTFKETPGGRLSSAIDHWSVEKIKRTGADAVKVLTWYRPDADKNICRQQQEFTARIGEACARYDIPYVFELLVYPLPGDAGQTKEYVEMKTKKPELVLESVQTFADPKFGVDLFKLESPLAAEDVTGVGGEGWQEIQTWFDEMGALAGRPWVMLSAGADMQSFRNILTHAYQAGSSGYLAGRAIWLKAFQEFPDWQKLRSVLRNEGVPYMQELNTLTDAEATPWEKHPRFLNGNTGGLPDDASFRHHYAGFGA